MGSHSIWGLAQPVITDKVEDRHNWECVTGSKFINNPRVMTSYKPYCFACHCVQPNRQNLNSMTIPTVPTQWLPHTFGSARQLLCQLPSHCPQSSHDSTEGTLSSNAETHGCFHLKIQLLTPSEKRADLNWEDGLWDYRGEVLITILSLSCLTLSHHVTAQFLAGY